MNIDNGQLALLFAPSIWGLYAVRLRQVRAEGEEYGYGDFLDDADMVDDIELRKLVKLCEGTASDTLFRKYGRQFSNKKLFIERADKTLKKYVTEQVERRLVEGVALAARLGVHLFFATKPGEYLKQHDELFYNAEPLTFHAAFAKTADGLDYRLTLGDGIVPSAHRVRIVCNTPSLFVLDHELRQLDDGLGGKLLSPFLKTEVYHIAASIQATYFRQFILKIVKRIDITSEGFEVDNRHPEGTLTLTLRQALGGDYMLEPSFVYDDVAFLVGDRREKNVTLHDDGHEVAFVCVWRDKAWEADRLHRLYDGLALPRTAPLADILDWVARHGKELERQHIAVRQLTSRKYVLGDVTITEQRRRSVDWFRLFVTLHFPDGTSMPLTSLAPAIVSGDREVQLPSGNWFVIPDEWFTRYSGVMLFGLRKGDGSVMVHRTQRTLLPPATDLDMGGDTEEQPTIAPSLDLPTGLDVALRPYQVEGYRWMLGHLYGGTGCCLGDDMGLGKTVQAIAVIEKYCESTRRPAPHAAASTEADAMLEARAAPVSKPAAGTQLSLFSDEEMTGKASRTPARKESVAATAATTDESGVGASADAADGRPLRLPVLVAAPSSVVFNWHDELRRFAPGLRVVEYVGAARERWLLMPSVRTADVVLTSYPMLRNDIAELAKVHFSIAVFDEAHAFRNSNSLLFHAICQLHADHPIALTGTPITNALDELWSLMGVLNPSLLGDKDDFMANFVHPISHQLQGEHTATLRKLVAPFFLRRLRSDVLSSLPERQDEMVWCDMGEGQRELYDKELSSMRNLLMDPEKANNKVVVLSAITRLRLLASCPAMAGHDVPSGKMDEVFSRLEELRGTDHKVLLFSEFTRFLDAIAKEMTARGWSYDLLTGQSRHREDIVKHFQQTPSCQFFLVSLKAGGEGLNLTQADYVFLLDPWWNSAAEEQAISRAHRSGQRRAVMVYRFISKGTLEEQILTVQDRKQDLIKAVLSVQRGKL